MAGILIERPNGGFYYRPDATSYEVDEEGFLHIKNDDCGPGESIVLYTPESWVAVEGVHDDDTRAEEWSARFGRE